MDTNLNNKIEADKDQTNNAEVNDREQNQENHNTSYSTNNENVDVEFEDDNGRVMDNKKKGKTKNSQTKKKRKESMHKEAKDKTKKEKMKKKGNGVIHNENNDKTKKARTKKNHNRFITSTFFTILIVLLFTIISVCSYVPVKDNILSTRHDTQDYLESDDFVHILAQFTRYLKKNIQYEGEWYDYRYKDLESIKYYSWNTDKTLSISNMADASADALQEQIKNSQFYLKVKIDDKGNPIKIESSLGKKFNEEEFINRLDLDYNGNTYANLDVLYIVPKNLDSYNDILTYYIRYRSFITCATLILIIVAISIFLLILLAFSISYSVQRKVPISKLYNKMFLELKVLILFGFVSACVQVIAYIINTFEFYGLSVIADAFYNANVYFFLIGIPVIFIAYLLVYLNIVYIKYIYYTGFIEGFVKKSITGKIFICIIKVLKSTVKRLQKIINEILSIDITKDDQKKLVMILGINLAALWLIALTSLFGLILALGYTAFLFRYLTKIFAKIRALNEASGQLVEGDFDITIDEDMGILSPISQNLNNIKEGFKIAVDKELKSQQMKTELISNVSHDLKTPLTSIITYVDLLKDEDISEETQREYIDVLDGKSKRLKVLIEDLFEASKAGSGNIELHLEKVDVIALLRQTLGELEEKIKKSTLKIITRTPEDKVICELDGRRTYRVFENIMSNILKYSMPNSRVYIEVAESETEVSLTFKNISNYEMDFDETEITERFTRGDQSRNTEGSGLGLAIAKSLIELQNGDLKITTDGDLFKLIVTFPK